MKRKLNKLQSLAGTKVEKTWEDNIWVNAFIVDNIQSEKSIFYSIGMYIYISIYAVVCLKPQTGNINPKRFEKLQIISPNFTLYWSYWKTLPMCFVRGRVWAVLRSPSSSCPISAASSGREYAFGASCFVKVFVKVCRLWGRTLGSVQVPLSASHFHPRVAWKLKEKCERKLRKCCDSTQMKKFWFNTFKKMIEDKKLAHHANGPGSCSYTTP